MKLFLKWLLCAFLGVVVFGLFWYHFGTLYWGATLINMDNTLSGKIEVNSFLYIAAGILFGAAIPFLRKHRPRTASEYFPLVVLFLASASVLIVAFSKDWGLVQFILKRLHGYFPERLQDCKFLSEQTILFGSLSFLVSCSFIYLIVRNIEDRKYQKGAQ